MILKLIFIALTVLLSGVSYQVYLRRKEERNKLRWYGTLKKNIYELSRSPHPHDKEVLKRCRERIDWLIKSGNKLRGPVKSVKVYAIMHKDLDVVCYWLEESPNDGKVMIVKKRINVDSTGVNATEPFEESEDPEKHTYPKRCREFIEKKDQERAVEVRFHITDKDVENAKEKNENFWETEWMEQEL